jgi:hypothetical protein
LVFLPVHTPPAQLFPGVHWAFPVHDWGQSGDVPAHRYWLHDGAPADPAGRFTHAPTAPETLHALQDPRQAVLQHTPSTQRLEAHELAAVHGNPLPFLGTQVPLKQNLPAMHWPSEVHALGQSVLAPEQR